MGLLSAPFITLPYKIERAPPPFEDNDIKSPESLARYFIAEYTTKGARVFDPFAGLGTTLFMAEKMGRIPFGIEYEGRRQEWVAGQMQHWGNLIHGDAGDMAGYGFPKMDFCLTCPPFMKIADKWNPLYAGDPAYNGYAQYLKRMGFIFKQMTRVMKRGAAVAVQVDNLPGRPYTPLVRDVSVEIGKHMRITNEITVAWKAGPESYRHTQILLFKNSA